MARGVLSGVIWGAVVAGVGAGGLSLAYPEFKPGGMSAPEAGVEAAAPDAAETPQESTASDEVAADAPSDAAPEPADAPDTETAMVAPTEQAAPEAAPEPQSAPAQDSTEEMAEEAAAEPETAEPAQDPAQDEAAQTAQTATETQEPDPAPAPQPATPPAPQVVQQAEPEPEAEAVPGAQTPQPSGTVGNLAEGVTTGRLPSVGSDAEEEGGPSATAPPPLERFAADIEIDDSKPLMSIVLIDDGSTDLGLEALESFPYPLTFAVDAAAENAGALMDKYRAQGLEVAALVSMPQGATASDTEIAMAGYFAAVPEAVALLEDPDASLQVNRDISDQVIEILGASGHGIVFQSSGLNTAQKLAVREGIGAGRVFRDFDGSGQSATVMRRFLDQAAFRAGQEGGVIMLGRLQAETISALLIWGLADRASRVSLVPVSAVLRKNLGEDG